MDVGSKRIGLAISDLLGITAQGLATLHRQNKRTDFAQLERVIAEYDVAEIVMGLPLRMSGAEGIQAEKCKPSLKNSPAFQAAGAFMGRASHLRASQPPAAGDGYVDQAPRRGGRSDGSSFDFAELDGCEKRGSQRNPSLAVGRWSLARTNRPRISRIKTLFTAKSV